MRVGPAGRLYVAQAFGSQVSAIDIASGAVTTISRIGGPIVGPDDLAFDSRGTLYLTEVMSERVCARSPNGDVRIIADNVPGANGITAWHDRLFMDECRHDGRLFELFPDGRAPRQLADKLPLPNALSVGPDGSERRLVGPGFLGPMGLAVADDGTIYAADGISMAAVAADGTAHRVGMLFDGQFPGFVRGVARGANGTLVVTTSAGDVTSYHPVTH